MMNKYILILSLLAASISTMAQMKDKSVYDNVCYMKAIEYIDIVDLNTTKTKKHISEEILKDSIDNKATITSEPKMEEPFTPTERIIGGRKVYYYKEELTTSGPKTEEPFTPTEQKLRGMGVLYYYEKDTIASDSEAEKPFTLVEDQPSFHGGEEAMMQFISDNLIYPESAQQAGLQGRVIVRMVVEPDGSLSDITLIGGFDKECDNEAARVIASMPKWIPGKQNGKEVRVYYTIPVVFRLK